MIGNLLGLDTFLVRRLKLSHTEREGVGRQAKDGADKESVWFSARYNVTAGLLTSI